MLTNYPTLSALKEEALFWNYYRVAFDGTRWLYALCVAWCVSLVAQSLPQITHCSKKCQRFSQEFVTSARNGLVLKENKMPGQTKLVQSEWVFQLANFYKPDCFFKQDLNRVVCTFEQLGIWDQAFASAKLKIQSVCFKKNYRLL